MKLTIGKKLGLGFTAVILLMAVSSAVAYIRISDVNRRAMDLVDDDFPTVRALDSILNGLNGSLAGLRGFLILGNDTEYAEFFKSERRLSWQDIDTGMQRVTEAFEDSADPADRKDFDIVRSNLEPLRQAQKRVEDAAQESFASGGDLAQATALLETDAVPASVAIRTALRELKRRAVQAVAANRTNMSTSATTVKTTLVTATLIAVLMGGIVAMLLSWKISSGVKTLLAGVQNVAEGDLTQERLRESEDEIGQLAASFNRMTDSLKRVLTEVHRMTGELGASSQEINSAAHEQVASMTQSASSVNEISATSEEFKATIQEFADRAKAVREAAEETANRASQGLDLTESTSQKNEEVRRSFEAAGESILKLSEQMQQITQVTTSVNEIAEQTKLLALNASIEAARAGEEGRGFAVVATQVRELANQSKEASARIASQITEIQSAMQTVIGNSERGNETLNDANQMGQQMARAFREIAHSIDQTTDAMKQIDQAAGQQESGISDLVTGIADISSGAKETLATAEQTQKAIAGIEQRASELDKIMSRFKT